MNEICSLLKLELCSFFGINKFLHTKDKKLKTRYRGLMIAWIIVIILAFSYVSGLVFGLCSLGLNSIVPHYLVTLSSLLILMFGLFSAGNKIFGQKSYDILASLPINPRFIVISRFLSLYIGDLCFALVIMLPGVVTYGINVNPSPLFYIFAIIGTLFIPIIPLVISILFGTFITAISSRMKNKSLMQAAFSVILVVGILAFSTVSGNMAESFTNDQFINLAQSISDILKEAYPPAVWLGDAIIGFDILKLLLFILVSLALMAFTVFIATRFFHQIVRRLLTFSSKNNYKMGKTQSRGMLKALYIREAKRYFSSSIYVTNTIIGPILGSIMAVALCVAGTDTITNALGFDINMPSLLPFVFSAVFCMMTTTSTSISMEGKQFWAVKSLPIPAKTLFDSKILFNLSLMLPFFTISSVAIIIAVKPNIFELLWIILIPIAVMLFSVILGITVNLKFHSFDWEYEAAVVKQSTSAVLGGFAGFFVSLILGITVFFTPQSFINLVMALICALLLILTLIIYRHNNKTRLENL